MDNSEDLVERLRKSVQQGEPDRLSDLLEESAREIEYLRYWLRENNNCKINLTKEN